MYGLEYYHALKGKLPEQDITMHWFENEGHLLDGVETSRIVQETSQDFFDRYRV
jgi:hypothetical protein